MYPAPLVISPLDRPAYWVLGDRYTVLLSAAETGGAFSLFDFIIPAGHGTPPHVHRREDETFMIVAGELVFTVAGKTRVVGPGDVVFGVRGIAHDFRNIGIEPARMFVTATPGGLEAFFAEAGIPAGDGIAPPPGPQERARMRSIAPRHGIEMVLPPI